MVPENKTAELDTTYVLLQDIQFYYTPILVYLGSFGNCLSLCVFFGTKLRYSSSSIYLGTLAISDTGFLISVFVVWLKMVNVDLFNQSGFCQFFIYFTSLCSFLSTWFVVAFTVERFLAVKYPFRRHSICTVAKAKAVVIGLTALGILLCSPTLLFSAPRLLANARGNITQCELAEGWESWAIVYNTIDTVLTFVVPFIVIVVFNTLIARNVYKLDRVRRTLTIESDASNERDMCMQNPRGRLPQIKVTKMLLVVSTAFLCFNLPSYVIRMFVFFHEKHYESLAIVLTQQMCNLLFNTNFGINIILYCASGQNFRRAMIRMFRHRSRHKDRTFIQMVNHGKQCVSQFSRKYSSTKQTHVDTLQKNNSQQVHTLSLNEEL